MYAVVRTYSGPGAKQLAAVLEENKQEIETVLRDVDGLVSYTLVSTGDGAVSVTICRDKAGTAESTRLAAQWVRENASDLKANPPVVNEGKVIIQIK